ncbi:tricyclene synthase EBOS, chloroplastic-like [Argentina anserina]|uniref:tricyclene synthase EBOS, chloroplastic-like n=1 Tax=Argentina anserina TaxID=57926 RepID=UPI0021767640|nr:tricyclene synthase EBOS, chloroplastic-like [Potentilla anserina]
MSALSLANRGSIATQTSNLDVQRRKADYKPSIWSYEYLHSLRTDNCNHEELYDINNRWKPMEEVVKHMIDQDGDARSVETSLEVIDDIQRLGLGHRFEGSITGALDKIMKNLDQITDKDTPSLHLTALSFRLLRQHGFTVSLDVFKVFTDCDGSFKDGLCKDVKGMLSLYEASFLGFEEESILDEARAFTSMTLKNLSRLQDTPGNGVSEKVSHALEMPLHHRMQRLEARRYIEAYNKSAGANQVLLELAKLDYNAVQQAYQTDLKDMSRWWKDIGLAKKLSFSRDRLMECFFWSVGIVFEPQLSNLRKGITKVSVLITIIDDVYDVYGTLAELKLFTSAVERWDVNAVEILADYQLKICFLALYNTVNEMAYETLKEQGVDVLPYLKKAWADLCKAFLKEAEWSHNKYTPTFEEYIANAWISSSAALILVHTYFLLNQNISDEALECLENHHDLLRWPSLILRLSNDLATSEAELERGETATSISCLKGGGCVGDVESARKYISNLIENSWKKMNKDGQLFGASSTSSPFTKEFVAAATNLARIAQCIYQYGDGIGAPDKIVKNRILAVILQPL